MSYDDIWGIGKTEHMVSQNIEDTTFLLNALGLPLIRKIIIFY